MCNKNQGVDGVADIAYTPGEWKSWNSGYTACPHIIYVGDKPPSLDRKGHLVWPEGSHYIGEFSSQNGRTNEREDWIAEDNHLVVLAAINNRAAVAELIAAAEETARESEIAELRGEVEARDRRIVKLEASLRLVKYLLETGGRDDPPVAEVVRAALSTEAAKREGV